MFYSKALWLKMIEKDGKHGWSGTLQQWELAREFKLMKFSLKAMKESFNAIWK